MVLSPDDLEAFSTDEHASYMSAENTIDNALRRSLRAGKHRTEVILAVPDALVREQLITNYAIAGWEITYQRGRWHLTPDPAEFTPNGERRHPAEPNYSLRR